MHKGTDGEDGKDNLYITVFSTQELFYTLLKRLLILYDKKITKM